MSEQSSEALNFGPQWIRDLSNGASVSVPPPSPGPSYKLAQFRYGKEEMLALFSKNLKPPIVNKDVGDYILKKEACKPLAMVPLTEEEQRNSFGSLNSVAVLKMMGRGGQRGRGMSRGGRGSGRGRGEQGFYRGFSQDDSSSNRTEEGWQRENISRKQSWGDGRGGFGDRGRDTETSPRGYDPTAPPSRHSRALASGNWRSSETDDDGGGWVTPRGSERAERWRTSSHGSWHRDEHTRERRFSDRDRSSFEDVPEWSKVDSVFEPDSGSFDASGAFCVAKGKKPPDDSSSGGGGGNSKEDWDLEIDKENHNDETECDVITKDLDTSQNTKEPPGNDNEEQEQVEAESTSSEDNTQPVIEEKSAGIEPSHRISPKEGHKIHAKIRQDEVGADLERVAESCIANLDVEGEEAAQEKRSVELQGGQRSVETNWFYRDPQGQEQGPFSSEEMVEWFHHGYFTMQLSVRRQCDAVYLSLGDLIKRWKRVPFLPGASPPPITHQQIINEVMQQQLLQQHYQNLQKQAFIQQMQQQQQLQHEQRQQAVESTLHLNFSSEKQPSRTVGSRILPTTTHSGSPIGAAEIIWGAEPQSPKDSWSAPENASSWNEPKRQTSPAIEEIQRREREREIERERLEAEKAETLRRKEEEEKRQIAKKQEEERLKRIEEERKQQEIQKKAEAAKLKQQETKKKLNATKEEQSASQSRGKGGMGRGKLYDMMEKETKLGRRQEQDEEKLKEESRKNRESEQRKQKSEGEKRKQEEAMKRSKATEPNNEELRREKEQVEELKEEEMKEKTSKKKESNQQKQSKSNDSPRWGTTTGQLGSTALSLSEIQEQEEKNWMAHEEKVEKLKAQQRQIQSAAAHGWVSDKLPTSNNIKSLKAIQDEQALQGPKQNRQLPRSQPTQSSSAWNTTWTAGNNNVWTGNHNDREEEQDSNDVMRARNTGKNQEQKNNITKQAKQSTTKPVTNGKKSGKKSSKEEESVRKIFQQTASNDPFTEWCTQSLQGLATAVDVPTFIGFLKELESPDEVRTYVTEYFGDNEKAKSFAKEFLERQQSSEWKHVPKKSSPPRHSTSSGVVARGGGTEQRSEPESSGGKKNKKKKQRMQKVDPSSILGFSVNAAAERVNMGEIQSIEDS